MRRRDRGITMLVRVDISASTDGVLSVALSHQPAGFAPYRIDNCTATTLHLRQVRPLHLRTHPSRTITHPAAGNTLPLPTPPHTWSCPAPPASWMTVVLNGNGEPQYSGRTSSTFSRLGHVVHFRWETWFYTAKHGAVKGLQRLET